MKSNFQNNKGFTLIELIISVALFAIIVTFSLGSMANVFSSNRKAESLRVAVDNANFVLDVMQRDIHFGSSFSCPGQPLGDCTGQSLSFLSPSGSSITYTLSGGVIYKDTCVTATPCPLALSSDKYVVNMLQFKLAGSVTPLEPLVTVYMKGTSGKGKEATAFDLQTSVSSKQLNI